MLLQNNNQENSNRQRQAVYVFILLAVFFSVFAARAYFKADSYSDTYSYYVLRNVESIQRDFVPLVDDRLSSATRFDFSEAVFFYLLAFFGFVFGNTYLWVFVNLAASSIVFAVFLISKTTTGNIPVALFTSFMSGFIAIFFSKTINSLSQYAFLIPGVFFLIYFLININKKKSNVAAFSALFIFLLLLNPSVAAFITGLFIYLVLLKIEKMSITSTEADVSFFSLFFSLWFYLLMFKSLLSEAGYSAIWQNIPKQILELYFSRTNIIDTLYLIGIIPSFAGLYVIYTRLFERKSKQIYVIISFALADIALFAFKLINLELGLMFLGVIMTLLFADFFHFFMSYLQKTKFSFLKWPAFMLVFLLFFLSSVFPSLSLALSEAGTSITQQEIDALRFLAGKAPGVVVAAPEEGYLVEYFAKKKPLLDYNFLFTPKTTQRYEDIKIIFTSAISSKVLELMDKYDARYIVFSDYAREKYNITRLAYTRDSYFSLIYNNSAVYIYSLNTTA